MEEQPKTTAEKIMVSCVIAFMLALMGGLFYLMAIGPFYDIEGPIQEKVFIPEHYETDVDMIPAGDIMIGVPGNRRYPDQYKLKIGGQEFPVPQEFYEKLDVGDTVVGRMWKQDTSTLTVIPKE